MRLSLSDMAHRRLVIGAASLAALLCLVLSACGSAPTSSVPAQAQNTPSRSHLPPVGSGGGGGGGGVTPTPIPAKLSASPTTISSWKACDLSSGSSCPYQGKPYTTVTLHNAGSADTLSWSIGSTSFSVSSSAFQFSPANGTISPGQSATLVIVVNDPAVIAAIAAGTLPTQSFEIAGPLNSVRITIP